jgi:hypothetical protein
VPPCPSIASHTNKSASWLNTTPISSKILKIFYIGLTNIGGKRLAKRDNVEAIEKRDNWSNTLPNKDSTK